MSAARAAFRTLWPSSASIWVPSTHSFTFPTLRYLTFCKMYCFGPAKSRSLPHENHNNARLVPTLPRALVWKIQRFKKQSRSNNVPTRKNGSKRHKKRHMEQRRRNESGASLQSGRNGGTHRDTDLTPSCQTQDHYTGKCEKFNGSCRYFWAGFRRLRPVPLD